MSYAATKRWRERHPEEARRLGREYSEKQRRRLGVPMRPKGGRAGTAKAIHAKREKMAVIMAEAKKSTCNLRMKK
ncbi:MAG: hypothetical protein M3Y08_19835 [Fibrobacterota bacterium]|nr:hypothetical protein [Fibrobacterota bacterium]